MKVKLTLSIESELVKIAKENNLNISEFLENELQKRLKIKKEVRWISA